MEIIPAIDLKSGRCVRLYQGDYGKETVYSDDPMEVALRWQREGAQRLHLVDLDGAALGKMANLDVIKEVVKVLDIPVQVGGGIRELETALDLLDTGVERVVLGTAVIQQPDLVEELCRRCGSESVVAAVDARDGVVAIKGWTEASSLHAMEVVRRMTALGVGRFLYTDIARDGTLTEPNFGALEELVASTNQPILASGGVSSLEHLLRLESVGVEGAIIGKALYTGDLDLSIALGTVKQST